MANIFPKWANAVPLKLAAALALFVTTVTCGIWYYATPKYADVGYQPVQPVPYDHSLHVGQLGLDCRYCHSNVTRSEHANVPSATTCMNCHNAVRPDSPLLAVVRESAASGKAVPWVRVHRMPDFVYFNHAVHVNRGVSCVDCHGQVNEMPVVFRSKPLTMAFCLDCHRSPERFVRPVDQVTNLNWKAETPEKQIEMGTKFVHDWKITPPQSCSGCHR